MLNSRTERKAIHSTANYFTEIGWFFREQPILDFGIDAFVEIGKNDRPSGNFIALQIKGGKSNFHKGKNGLTFYFDETHKQYWFEVGNTFPVFIIIQDPLNDKLYWGGITKKTIKKTTKHWKIILPFSNELINTSKIEIENVSTSHKASSSYAEDYSYLLNKNRVSKPLIDIRNHSKFGLQIKFKLENKPKIINLNYKPEKDEWDNNKGELKWNNPYHYVIDDIKKYVLGFNNNNEDSEKAINQIELQIKTGGISKLAEFLFDWNNRDNDVPKYSNFVEAFEYFLESEGKGGELYVLQTVGEVIYFRTGGVEYIINTYEGKIEELKYLIEKRAYSEIYTMTNENIWSEIYLDAGIEKAYFIPVMHNLWEEYWDNLYKRIKKEVGKTNHLDKSKERSWRQFQIFSESYNDVGDVIKYAYALDDMDIYPLAVVSMMNIFDADVCYLEYCEYEFEMGDWESICVDDDYNKPIFHIKINEL
ncbi:DUF4365 domain-containing protein [Winogradskyella sp. A3E31]|uniref:DUF4365 domain-containing protein n=1 Tax=Winogradskyella sp. A3E31 TaxID=3349637 RepID=UPI00398A8ED3